MTPELKKVLGAALKKSPNIVRDLKTYETIKRIPLDSPQMTYMFSGGLPIGRIHNFFGMESGGKSTVATYLCSQLQKRMPETQRTILYLDFERSFDKAFAENIGLDCSDELFIYATPDSIEDAVDLSCDLIKTGSLAGIVLDSDAASPTKTQMVDQFGRATFGGSAKGLSEGLRKMNILCSNYGVTLFTISQERANMQPLSHAAAVTGGFASKYYPSTRNKITKTGVIKEGNETIGISIRVRNFKNKAGIPFRDSNMNLYFGNGTNGIKGFDSDSEYIQFFFDLKLIEQRGAYFKSEEHGFNLNGRAKVLEWMEAHPEPYAELKAKVTDLLSGATILDANNTDPNLEEPEDGGSKEVIDEEIIEDEEEMIYTDSKEGDD